MLPTPQQHIARQQTNKQGGAGVWRGLLAGAAIGSAGFLLFFYVIPIPARFDAAVEQSNPWIILGGTLLLLYATLLWHELGHIVGGLLAGFQFTLYIAGPLMIVREGDAIRVRLNRHLSLYGGLAATTPTDDHNLIRRMQWMVAGGPLASLALTALGIAGSMLLSPANAPNAWLLALFAALSGFFNFLAVSVPGRTGGFLTDRARWQLLRRGGAPAARVAASATLQAQSLAGTSPTHWDPATIATAVGPADQSLDYLANRLQYGYTAAAACGQLTTAADHLAAVLAHIAQLPALLHPAIYLETAFLSALNANADEARDWLALAGNSPFVEEATRRRVAAAIAAAAGDVQTTQTELAAARAALASASRSTTAIETALLAQLSRATF